MSDSKSEQPLSSFSPKTMQQSSAEESVKKKMESLRSMCESEIRVQQQRVDSFTGPFQRSLESVVERAHTTVQSQAELARIKAELRESEDELVKVLAVKTRKEARQMAIRDSISATKTRIEELKGALQLQRSKRDGYAAIISQQSLALATSKESASQGIKERADTQEAILWYNRVLGFHVEGGHGVKFTFTKINATNPKQEYSFTVHYANDTYALLDCNPHLNEIKELVQDLNSTNDLFRFIRSMRVKFREATLHEIPTQSENLHQESSTISASAPLFSVSTDASNSPLENSEPKVLREINQQDKNGIHAKRTKSPILSPGSASSCRRSSRLKGKK